MKSSKWLYRFLVFALAVCVLHGCSNSSTPPSQTFPLTLTLVSHTQWQVFDTLQFQVTKSGKNHAGATLISIAYPYYNKTYLGTSDSTGRFPAVDITRTDSNASIAYQAIDSLTSNYVYWSWQ